MQRRRIMGYQDAKYRSYEKMSSNGLRPMNNTERVEEAVDTIKIGKRKAINGKATLEAFFQGGCTDQSLCREGLLDLQNGLEMLLKGLIEYYGESYIENHYTDRNGEILENLNRQVPEIHELHNAFGILQDDDFSFMMYKCSKFPRYQTFKTNRNFRNLAYTLADLLINYANTYILNI
jgi:hypothetical protein